MIDINVSKRVGIITLNNPPLNISTRALKDELRTAIENMASRPDIAVILLAASGERAFSVGSDVKELKEAAEKNSVKERALHENSLNNDIENLEKPTIAAINGLALGGGLELALACDMRICSRQAQFGFPEIKLGLFPGGGGSERLPRLIGYPAALELMLTGKLIDAAEALRLGLVNRIADGELLQAALAFANEIAGFSVDAIKRIKRVTRRAMVLPFSQANNLSLDDCVLAFHSKAGQEGISAFLEKRAPNFEDTR